MWWRARSKRIDHRPLAAGIGEAEDELYTLNETGKATWGKLDGVRTLAQIASELAGEYSAPPLTSSVMSPAWWPSWCGVGW